MCKKSVDSDQMASLEASWSGCSVFSKIDKTGFSTTEVITLFIHVSFSNVPLNETQDGIYSKTVYHNIHMEMDDNLCVKQCGSWSDGFFRSQLIWIYSVFKKG